mmetsp:Transcript_13710/g.25711  ORF Transcript_13710/g.25711 Transcript_13710/m.25711 type:complete len:612 (+) Transcript_13710:81-1916(+)
MARWFFRGACAFFVLASAGADSVPELLAEDSECASNEECALNALQRHALQKKGPAIAAYGQCGGAKYKGPTECAAGLKCVESNEWYSQCEPAQASADAVPSPGAVEAHADEPAEKTEAAVPKPEAKTTMSLPKRPPMPAPKIYDTVNPIISRGNFLYDSVTGKRFFAKGVAYNPRNEFYSHEFGPSVHIDGWVDTCVPGTPKGGYRGYTADVTEDELEEYWTADLEAMANMGANTVRLYNVDPQKSHAKFMNKAASLGIYVIVPLTGKDYGFLPAFPAPDCYTMDIEEYGNVGVNLLGFAKSLMKEFSQYNNTLLFTAANELAQLDKNGYAAFPCVKAFVRDLHNYQADCAESMRKVPLIYSDVDTGGGDARKVVAQYLTCALESDADAVDAYGLNVYSWCDETYPGDGKADNFQYSPYKDIKKDFKDFSVPFIFSEFGCNLGVFKTKCPYPDGRTWPDVKHFLGEDMGEFMSGAVAFQWSMDKEEYGLTLSPGFLAGQDKLYLLDNYFNLQKQYKKYLVNSSWDAPPPQVDQCDFVPSDVAPMEEKHTRPACPSKAEWMKVQTQRRVDKVVDWTILPPPAVAPIGNETLNISECAVGETVASALTCPFPH